MRNSTTTTPTAEPWSSDDLYIEASCSVSDPDWGDASEWPAWTDTVRVGLGAPLDDDESLDPQAPRPDNTPDPDDLDDLEIDEDDDLGPLWEGSSDEWPCYVPPSEDMRRGAAGYPGDEAYWTDCEVAR